MPAEEFPMTDLTHKTIDLTAERAVDAARRHGQTSGMVEDEVYALQDLLRAALSMLSPKAREIWQAKADVQAILEPRA
jgi:hypothetical protein